MEPSIDQLQNPLAYWLTISVPRIDDGLRLYLVPDDVVHWGVTSVFNNKDFSDQLQEKENGCGCPGSFQEIKSKIGCCFMGSGCQKLEKNLGGGTLFLVRPF
ncbi:unnamed protein product [Lactuca virosa]|uniref:Uncharacterized protein n=1 Tax=Lactuca virosa TaxID=75947 RepID=A0AAU9MMW7_9ASTR|nr:unnamed protein product [Lactuca virosa]